MKSTFSCCRVDASSRTRAGGHVQSPVPQAAPSPPGVERRSLFSVRGGGALGGVIRTRRLLLRRAPSCAFLPKLLPLQTQQETRPSFS